LKVEIWSDVVCPWCYIGKRRFEAALARFPHADRIAVEWKSFELDPSAPRRLDGDLAGQLAAKYGVSRAEADGMHARMTGVAAEEGLDFRFDIAQSGSTFDAHRLLHLAADRGLQGALKERLVRAYLTEGEPIGEPATLARLAAEVGLPAADVAAVLDSDTYAEQVRADEQEARALGITGVPFFVVDRRYGVSGAQPADLLLEVLQKAWAEANPLTVIGGADSQSGDASCADGSCAV
jgi:predicted DsbA family dithiol-disulfide isomerase